MPRREYDSDLEPRPRRRPRRGRGTSDPNWALIFVCLAIGLLFLAGAVAIGFFALRGKNPVAANPDVGIGPAIGLGKTDLELLEGTWESTFRDANGNVAMHKVKQIAGNTETATWFAANGNRFRANQVQFELGTRGANKVFRYFNGRVLFGPDAGMPFPSGEYAYTLEGDTWTEYVPTGGTIVWTRRR